MSAHHSDNMSQGSQVSQSAPWQCFSKVCWSDEATYRAVPLFSEGQLKRLKFGFNFGPQKVPELKKAKIWNQPWATKNPRAEKAEN